MNKFIALFALITGFAVLAPTSAEAGGRHSSSSSRCVSHRCGSCGSPVYKIRVVVGCDRHGCHIYGWRTQSHRCAPRYYGGGHDHGHGRDYSRHGSGYGSGYRRGR